MAQSYLAADKYVEAYALFDRAADRAEEALAGQEVGVLLHASRCNALNLMQAPFCDVAQY